MDRVHELIEVVAVTAQLGQNHGIGNGDDANFVVVHGRAHEFRKCQAIAGRAPLPTSQFGMQDANVEKGKPGASAVPSPGLGVSPTRGSCVHNCPSGYGAELSFG